MLDGAGVDPTHNFWQVVGLFDEFDDNGSVAKDDTVLCAAEDHFEVAVVASSLHHCDAGVHR